MGPEEIHVWFARCDRQADSKREWWDTLSAAEKTRAESFRFTRDRACYVAAHGILRELLGRYTGLPPASLRFGTTAHGKPELGQASGRSQLGFNALRHQMTFRGRGFRGGAGAKGSGGRGPG